jgi:rod shape-determining protein MreD
VRGSLVAPSLRILPVGLVALSLQRVIFANHPIHDVRLQLVLALVVAAGVGGGADRGAVAGFALGLLADASGDTALGVLALAYGVGGMTAGYLHRFTTDPQWWLAAIFATIGAAVGELMIPLVKTVTGESGWINTDLLITVPIVAVSCGLLCPLLMPVGRWMMGFKRKKWKAMAE